MKAHDILDDEVIDANNFSKVYAKVGIRVELVVRYSRLLEANHNLVTIKNSKNIFMLILFLLTKVI